MRKSLGMATLDQGKELPKVIEFIEFCIVSRGGWKVFPIRAAKMYRFFFWLVRRKNLGRSWASVLPYKRAVVRWAQSWQRDPFEVITPQLRDHLRKCFKNAVHEVVMQPKIMLSDELFIAIWEVLSDEDESEFVDKNILMVYKIAGFRAASLALGSDRRRWARVVRIKHVKFLPSRADPQRAFVLLPQTKTRPGCWQPVGHVISRNPDPESERCAVKRLLKQVELRERDGASRDDVLFSNPRTGKPYSKNVLNSRLKSLIDRVASRWIGDTRLPGKPSDFFSAVSFRKAVLTRLKEGGLSPTQIATYADHKSIQSQMAYVCETFQAAGDTAAVLYERL